MTRETWASYLSCSILWIIRMGWLTGFGCSSFCLPEVLLGLLVRLPSSLGVVAAPAGASSERCEPVAPSLADPRIRRVISKGIFPDCTLPVAGLWLRSWL